MAIARIRKLAGALGLITAVATGAGWSGGTVEAGISGGTATINVYVTGANADAVAAAAIPTTTGSLVCSSGFTGTGSGLFATQAFSCNSGGADETIGIDGVPANALVTVSCNPNNGQPDQISPNNVFSTCSIYVDIPTLIVDKLVVGGGPLTSSDFAIEVYDSGGALVSTTNDPDPATCRRESGGLLGRGARRRLVPTR